MNFVSKDPPNSSSLPVAVIGGGIAGLAAAYQLSRYGRRVILLESAPRVGGVIRSERSPEGWLVEAGPNSFQENSRATATFLQELGLAADITPASGVAKKRFIVRGGRPCQAPMSPPSLIATPLLSSRGKLRIFRDLFFSRRSRPADVSVAAFVSEHFGSELLDYAFNPLVAGVYAGDPQKLSAQHAFPLLWKVEQSHGSLIRGLIATARDRKRRSEPKTRLISFRDGLQMLPDALARALPADCIRLNATLETLTPPATPGAPWRIGFRTTNSTRADNAESSLQVESCASVILTVPAHALAKVVIASDPTTSASSGAPANRPFAELADIAYPAVASMFLGYRREQVAHPLDGFGMLVPEVERRQILGVLFSSSLFPQRAPEGHVALTVLVGGTRQPALAHLPADRLLETIMPDLRELLGVSGEPVFIRHNVSARAIPQYNLGHERFLQVIARAEQAFDGLFVGGQVRDGISVPACLQAGLTLASRAHER